MNCVYSYLLMLVCSRGGGKSSGEPSAFLFDFQGGSDSKLVGSMLGFDEGFGYPLLLNRNTRSRVL